MKRYLLYMLLFLTWSLIACDDGKIYDETVIVTGEGRTLKLTGQITGVESWPEEYSVVVAGFGDGEFAVASKSVPASAADAGGPRPPRGSRWRDPGWSIRAWRGHTARWPPCVFLERTAGARACPPLKRCSRQWPRAGRTTAWCPSR